jgi:UDP-N-acetylglucosamine 2-epimerase (non-hydrolysing)
MRRYAAVKILCVIGTRPEAIKMAPVIHELRRSGGRAEVKVCVTGQHRDLLDPALSLFEIRPDYDLAVMQEGQLLADLSARVLTGLEPVVAKEQPDWMLVQGDTTTTVAAALVGFYHRVRVGHVEAGLRTGNKLQPFPEEMNRAIVDRLADLHFAPTETARQNLLREGIESTSIRVTGNTVVDAVHWVSALPSPPEVTGWVPSTSARIVLVTMHRRESFGPPIESVCGALRDLAERYGDRLQIVFPLHLNPNAQVPARRILRGISNVSLVPPLDYLSLVHLMKRSYLVLTDSGGIQEEAPALGKPVLVLREVTERPEGIASGVAKLIGTDREHVVAETARLLEDPVLHQRMSRPLNLYGDGHAARRIVEALLSAPAT